MVTIINLSTRSFIQYSDLFVLNENDNKVVIKNLEKEIL